MIPPYEIVTRLTIKRPPVEVKPCEQNQKKNKKIATINASVIAYFTSEIVAANVYLDALNLFPDNGASSSRCIFEMAHSTTKWKTIETPFSENVDKFQWRQWQQKVPGIS